MNNVSIFDALRVYFKSAFDYDGSIEIKTSERKGDAELYDVTTDGEEYTVVSYDDSPALFYCEKGSEASVSMWRSTSGYPVVLIDGMPREIPH